MPIHTGRKAIWLASVGALALTAASTASMAQTGSRASSANVPVEATYNIDIPAESLSQALKNFGLQTSQQIMFSEDVVRGQQSPTVRGRFTPREALSMLLKQTDLAVNPKSGGAFLIERKKKGDVRLAEPAPIVLAQALPATSAAGNTTEVVTVTSTRVVRDGYDAPTPTTVLGTAELEAKAPANLADFVNELPSLSGSTTPRSIISAVSAGNGGINALNLRELGENRTLVLLDGQRVGASSLAGFIDVNLFPQALVKRVDIVTGGASANWGSDAVAGVVNFVLDKDFTGLKGVMQGGITTYGDGANYKVALTGGTNFLSGRGHVLLNVEHAYDAGIRQVPRNWYDGAKLFFNPAYTATNGQPELLVGNHIGFSTATPGGIITAGPLKGTVFGPGGVPTQFNYGPLVSDPFMQGGEWQYADFAKSGDLDPRLSRQNVFFRTSFDVTDHFQVFAQLSWGASASYVQFGDQYNLGNITVRSDNAFIPANIAARIGALNISSFKLGTFNQDLGSAILKSNRTVWRPVIGASGDFDALGSNWNWDIYGQKSIANSLVSFNTTITANYQAAIDSVRNSAGAIVCRSTLTNPANGCVPYNIMGTGVNSQAALDYVKGTAWGRTDLSEDVVAGNLRGNPISNWAGPVSVALGFEHRREGVGGSADPLSIARSYFAGNYQVSHGAYNVTEGYFEMVMPLAKDEFLAKSLDFDGAIRETGYSVSGVVPTWKVGLNYSPIDDISVRATLSRDIRAPNLSELFQHNQTVTTSFTDPFNNNASSIGFSVTQGNLNVKPEVANSMGLGVVLRPSFLEGFQASIDYYSINIGNAISTPGAGLTINECFAGRTELCSQITRDSAGAISQVVVQPVNLTKQIARGLDFEASYRQSLDAIAPFLGGDLTLRGLATRYLKNYQNDGFNPPTDNVGTNSGRTPLPTWRYLATVGWDQGPLGVRLSARGFSAGVYNTSYIQCTSGCPTSSTTSRTINNSYLPGATYFDANITYYLTDEAQTFLSIDNLFNKDPAQVAYGTGVGGAPLPIAPALYDVLGRKFRLGVRFNM